jgi:uncharacterized membrane protein YjfL (UPF0719 family)
MHTQLFMIGVAKLVFGVLVGACGIFLGTRVLQKLLHDEDTDRELRSGNLSIGILQAAALLALGLLVQPAVQATFDAMDLLYRGQSLTARMFPRFFVYAVLHVGTSMMVGAGVIAIGTFMYARLTRGVDELAEVRRGNVAPAITLAAVIVVMSLMAAPGLRSILDGLLPLPELPRNVLPMPS